jgi:radical SAM superfamily enzyme YgiQ (UPF0313 family)
MKLLLISPPFGDPTLPCVGAAYLTACVRADGRHEVVQADLNLEVLQRVLDESTLQAALTRLEHRNDPQLAVTSRRHALVMLPQLISRALADLRSPEAFFSAPRYRQATNVVVLALHLLSSAMSPWRIDDELNGFVRSQPPLTLEDYEADLTSFAESQFNPFRDAMDELVDGYLREHCPDVVGISTILDGQAMAARYISRRIKSAHPEISVVIGGPSVVDQVNRLRVDPAAAMPVLFGNADYLGLGEGEPTLVPLLDALAAATIPDEVANLGFIHPETGRFTITRQERVKDLDALPPPHYEPEHFKLAWLPMPVTLIAPTRGCYWSRCAFCAHGLREDGKATAPYREMSPEILVHHVRHIAEQTGTRHLIFSIDVIVPKTAEQYARAFLDADLPVSWQADIRPQGDWMRPGRIEILSRGGLRHVSMGIESCSQPVLDSMRKGTRAEDFGPLFAAFDGAGIAVDLALFRGFPHETDEQLRDSLELLERNLAHIHRPLRYGNFYLVDGCAVRLEPELFNIELHPLGEGSALRPDHWQWSLAGGGGQHLATLSEETRQAMKRVCGSTHIADRPWVGSLGSAHTFLYFACAGLDSVRQYNTFIDRVRTFLVQQVSFAAD